MSRIQFFYKPEKPVDYKDLRFQVAGSDFSDILTEEDRRIRNDIWGELVKEKKEKIFSRPGGLGCLVDTRDSVLTFRPTDFMTYVATSRSHARRSLSKQVYDNMRVSAVGGTLKLADSLVFIHRRSSNVTHAADKLDSSIAGLAHINEDGKIDFRKALFEKLQRELKIKEGEIKNLAVTGVHSSYDPDFSGMVDFAVETNLHARDIEERIDKSYFGEHFFVPNDKLANFVFEHYAIEKDMIGDGCATILASLDHNVFLGIVEKIRRQLDNGIIQFGRLENGLYIQKLGNFD